MNALEKYAAKQFLIEKLAETTHRYRKRESEGFAVVPNRRIYAGGELGTPIQKFKSRFAQGTLTAPVKARSRVLPRNMELLPLGSGSRSGDPVMKRGQHLRGDYIPRFAQGTLTAPVKRKK